MLQNRRHMLLGFLIVFACSCRLHAAERITLLVDSAWDTRKMSAADTNFNAASSELERCSFDPLASELVNAEDRWTTFIFNLPSLTRSRAITYRNSVGDNLLTEWDFQESLGAGKVILRDTPYYSTFTFRVAATTWQ